MNNRPPVSPQDSHIVTSHSDEELKWFENSFIEHGKKGPVSAYDCEETEDRVAYTEPYIIESNSQKPALTKNNEPASAKSSSSSTSQIFNALGAGERPKEGVMPGKRVKIVEDDAEIKIAKDGTPYTGVDIQEIIDLQNEQKNTHRSEGSTDDAMHDEVNANNNNYFRMCNML